MVESIPGVANRIDGLNLCPWCACRVSIEQNMFNNAEKEANNERTSPINGNESDNDECILEQLTRARVRATCGCLRHAQRM